MKKKKKQKNKRMKEYKKKKQRDINIIALYTQTNYSHGKIAKICRTKPTIVSYVCSKFRKQEKF